LATQDADLIAELQCAVLKGHGFSRADKLPKISGL